MRRPRLTRLIPALAVGIVTMALPTAIFGSPDCYNTSDPCYGNSNCSGLDNFTPYCKQLCPPLSDIGCCAYLYWTDDYTGPGNGSCPCAGQIYNQVTGATLSATLTCYKDGVAQPCDTDVSGGGCDL